MEYCYYEIKKPPESAPGVSKWDYDSVANMALAGIIKTGLLQYMDHPTRSDHFIGKLKCGVGFCDFDMAHPDFTEIAEDVGCALFDKATIPSKIQSHSTLMANLQKAKLELDAQIIKAEIDAVKMKDDLAAANLKLGL